MTLAREVMLIVERLDMQVRKESFDKQSNMLKHICPNLTKYIQCSSQVKSI